MLTATASLECVWLCQSNSTDSLSGQTRAHTRACTYKHARTHLAVLPPNMDSVRRPSRGAHTKAKPSSSEWTDSQRTKRGELSKSPLLTSVEASSSVFFELEGPSDDCPCHKRPTPAIGLLSQLMLLLRPNLYIFLTNVFFHALSRSLYFLRRTDTWSLKSTGSRRNWEWTRGM